MTNILHSSATQEHYTPADVVEAAREVLGGIDLDPASCAEANATVRATRYFTRADDGLDRAWGGGRVFLNPPGGTFTGRKPGPPTTPEDRVHRERWGTDSRAVAWWRKLMYEQGRPAGSDVTAAVFIGFTIEILSTAQDEAWISPMFFPFCVPSYRLRFGGDQPTHANVIVYTGPDVARFEAVFSAFGAVKL